MKGSTAAPSIRSATPRSRRIFRRTPKARRLIEVGGTKVICTASVEDRVPMFLRNKGVGWVTAEYAMLPRATNTRTQRETQRPSGRTQEIQRLIGRSLRAVVDTKLLGERQIYYRLRRDPGRRRDSLRFDHRSIRRSRTCLPKAR